MRAIAFLHIPNSPFASVALSYRRLAEASAARGDQLDIITPESYRRLSHLDPRTLPFLLPFAVAGSLWRHVNRVDLVLFHSYTGWAFNLFRFGRRIPTITAFHGLEPLFYQELDAETRAQGKRLSWRFRFTYGWLMPTVLRLSCRRSDRVFCRNRAEMRFLLEHGWTEADRIVLIQAGTPPEAFVSGREYPPAARKFLVVSQWLDTKGTRYLVEAFTNLVRSGLDIELHCAGTRQPHARVLESFPSDVRDRVYNHRDIEHRTLLELYRDCDVFVHPSLSEGFSNAQLEAMAAALPMVVTDTAPASDLLVDRQSCLFVPKRDAAALEAALRVVIADRDLRRTLGQAAHGIALSLTTDASNRQILAVMADLVSHAR